MTQAALQMSDVERSSYHYQQGTVHATEWNGGHLFLTTYHENVPLHRNPYSALVFNNKHGLFRRVKFQMWKVSLSKFDALVLINFQTFNTSSNFLTINVSTSLQD